MKIFEIAWLAIAILSAGLGIYKWTGSSESRNNAWFLFLITALALFMFFLKRYSRKMLSRREKQNDTNATDS